MKTIKVEEIDIDRIKDMRWFIRKYGPRDKQIREYLLLKNIKNDDRYDLIKLIMDYAFVHRRALKMKSALHRALII